jgi:hypothetical protein
MFWQFLLMPSEPTTLSNLKVTLFLQAKAEDSIDGLLEGSEEGNPESIIVGAFDGVIDGCHDGDLGVTDGKALGRADGIMNG